LDVSRPDDAGAPAPWRRAVASAAGAVRTVRIRRRAAQARRSSAFRSDLGVFVFRGGLEAIGRQIVETFPPGDGPARVEAYRRRLDESGRRRLEEDVERAEALLAHHFPSLLRMLRGAAGAAPGCGFRELVVLNFSPVMVDWQRFWSCSAVAYRDVAGPVVGQNADLGRFAEFALAAVVPDDGSGFVAHLNRGSFWFGAGVNDHGLAVAGSSVNVEARDAQSSDRLPHTLLQAWLLASAGGVAQARRLLDAGPGLGPAADATNLLLADTSGALANLEVTGTDVVEVADGRSVKITTNHFRSPRLEGRNRRTDPAVCALEKNSRERYARALRWAEAPPTPERVRGLLRDGDGEGAWRRTAVAPDVGYTSASYVFDLGGRAVSWCTGHRVRGSFREVALEAVLGGRV
jgi:predicted choloylglycine hydrolase